MFYLLSRNTYASYLSARSGPAGARVYASAHACIHMCQVRKRCFVRARARGQLSISMHIRRFNAEHACVRACVRERVYATREKEGNKQLGVEKGTRREGRKKQPRKRVSLTNATRDRGRRVIITHLSPVGSGSPGIAASGGTPLGPARRAPTTRQHPVEAAPRSAICCVYGHASAIISFTP